MDQINSIVEKIVPDGFYVRAIFELDDAYLISTCPNEIGPNEEYLSGRYCTRLDKQTLEVTTYDILSDPEALKNAKKIK